MTTLEQLAEIFNGWRDQLFDQYKSENNDGEKMWLHGRLTELNRIQDKLKLMLWAGQISIKFNV